MSMRVEIALDGITDLEVMLTALEEMGIAAQKVLNKGSCAEAWAKIGGHDVDIVRNSDRNLVLVGDGDWRFMRSRIFQNRLRQRYSLVAVKRKAVALGYQIIDVLEQEDHTVKVVARAWG